MQRKQRLRREVNLRRLIQLIPSRHHHENVHVAVVVRLSISVRTKQDDLVRMKTFGNLPCESPYCPNGRGTGGLAHWFFDNVLDHGVYYMAARHVQVNTRFPGLD